jgi:hypothetical protein
MAIVVRPGLALRLNPDNSREGLLSGAALASPVMVSVVRRSSNGDALVTDRFQYWMVKASCVVCGENEAGKKRLEIIKNIYALVLKGDFKEAKKVFFEMHRLLL